MLRNLIICIALVFSFLSLSSAQVNTDTVLTEKKKENILKFMHNIKAAEMPSSTIDNIIQPYQTGIAAAPPSYWQNFKKLFPYDSVTIKMIDVYNKYFSIQDLVEMNKFLESPAGTKFMTNIPNATNDAWQIVEKWATETSVKVKDKLIMDGYINIQK